MADRARASLVPWSAPGCVPSYGHHEEALRRLRCAILAAPARSAMRGQEALAAVRAALPEGETCTDEEARAFLGAEGAKRGEGEPW